MAKKKSKGLGDTISKVTKAVGIKECKGCEERKEKLNSLFPYKRDITEDELQDWYSYLSKEDKLYGLEEQEYVMSVLRIVKGINLKSSVGCGSECWDGWIEMVNVELNKTK